MFIHHLISEDNVNHVDTHEQILAFMYEWSEFIRVLRNVTQHIEHQFLVHSSFHLFCLCYDLEYAASARDFV